MLILCEEWNPRVQNRVIAYILDWYLPPQVYEFQDEDPQRWSVFIHRHSPEDPQQSIPGEVSRVHECFTVYPCRCSTEIHISPWELSHHSCSTRSLRATTPVNCRVCSWQHHPSNTPSEGRSPSGAPSPPSGPSQTVGKEGGEKLSMRKKLTN